MAATGVAHIVQGPAVVHLVPPAPVPAPAASSPAPVPWPLLAICCLGLLGLLVASTIVLSLIPVYLKRKGENPGASQSAPFTITLNLANGTLPVGPLSAGDIAALQAQLDRIYLNNRRLFPCRPVIQSGTVVSSGRRKKRFSLYKRQAVGQQIILTTTLQCGRGCAGQCIANKGTILSGILQNTPPFPVFFPSAGETIIVTPGPVSPIQSAGAGAATAAPTVAPPVGTVASTTTQAVSPGLM